MTQKPTTNIVTDHEIKEEKNNDNTDIVQQIEENDNQDFLKFDPGLNAWTLQRDQSVNTTRIFFDFNGNLKKEKDVTEKNEGQFNIVKQLTVNFKNSNELSSLLDIQAYLMSVYVNYKQDKILRKNQLTGGNEFINKSITQLNRDDLKQLSEKKGTATKEINDQYVKCIKTHLKQNCNSADQSCQLFEIESTDDFSQVRFNQQFWDSIKNLTFEFDSPMKNKTDALRESSDEEKHQNTSVNQQTKKSTDHIKKALCILFAGVLALWAVASLAFSYLFAAYDFLKFNNIDTLHLKRNITAFHICFVTLASCLLLGSLITLMKVTGGSVYQTVLKMLENPNQLKESIKKTNAKSCVGAVLSIVCTLVYMLWAYFDTFSLFHNQCLAILSAIGLGLSTMLFIMPKVIRALNHSSDHHSSQTIQKKNYAKWLWLFIPVLGELLISPVFVDSMRTDFKQSLHMRKQCLLLGLSIAFSVLSTITMVLSTQSEKKQRLLPLNKRTGLGYGLLLCTATIGGICSTYIGLKDLNFIPHTTLGNIACIAWSVLSSLYWCVFYYPLIPMLAKQTETNNENSIGNDSSNIDESISTVSTMSNAKS